MTVRIPAVSLQRFEGIYCLCHQGGEVTGEKQEGYSLPMALELRDSKSLAAVSRTTFYHPILIVDSILLAFAKLRKTILGFVMSVHPSVRLEQQGYQRKDFNEI